MDVEQLDTIIFAEIKWPRKNSEHKITSIFKLEIILSLITDKHHTMTIRFSEVTVIARGGGHLESLPVGTVVR